MRVPNVMVVNNDIPAKTVKEFITTSKPTLARST